MESWKDMEYIYFVLGIEESKHWVAVEICVGTWEMVVYDCNIFVTPEDLFKEIMYPFTKLIPSLMRKSRLFSWSEELQGDEPKPMSYI